jgi:Tfp pilus assembly protein FimV
MGIKIISALLILLTSLAGCSADKASRQATHKICSPAANLHAPDEEVPHAPAPPEPPAPAPAPASVVPQPAPSTLPPLSPQEQKNYDFYNKFTIPQLLQRLANTARVSPTILAVVRRILGERGVAIPE